MLAQNSAQNWMLIAAFNSPVLCVMFNTTNSKGYCKTKNPTIMSKKKKKKRKKKHQYP